MLLIYCSIMRNLYFLFLFFPNTLGKSIFETIARNTAGSSQCYVCVHECDEPLATHFCEDVLDLGEGDIAACLHYEVKHENESSISKGCIIDSSEIRDVCATSDILYPEITCSLCTSDLCNGIAEGEEDGGNNTGVDECYFCSNNCTAPLPIQKCAESGIGGEAVCIAANMVLDGETYDIRGCVENSLQTQQICASASLLGGTCSLCNTSLCNNIENDGDGEGDGEGDDNGNIDLDVEQCYYCEHPCKDSIKIHNCQDMWGSDSKMSCITIDVPLPNGGRYVTRGCTENTASNHQICAAINYLNGNCTMCTSNLCNAKNDDGSNDNDKGSSSCLCLKNSFINILLVLLITTLFKI